MAQKVAVVILNYNGRAFLEKFLPAVVAYSPHGSVYVVDNASTDTSVAYLKTWETAVKTILLSRNEGFAEGYNRGLAQIEADYYVLLNSDVEVTPQWLTPLLDFLDTHPQVAACQPKILAHHNKTQFEYAGAAGGHLDWLGFSYCRGRVFFDCESDTGQYDTNKPVFWASGACMLVRAKLFHEAGGFDADFFAHFEEIDLCWRLHLAGYQVYCCPASTVYHVGGGTLPQSNAFKTFLNHRNSLAMLYKNLPSHRLWPTIFGRLVIDGLSAVRFLPKMQWQNIWAVVRAHFAFYGWLLGSLPAKRRNIAQKYDLNKAWKSLPITPNSVVWGYFFKNKKTYYTLTTD